MTERDNGGDLAVRVGDTIEVHLPENAAGGYRWAYDSDDAGVLKLVEQGSNYPGEPVGSAGEAIFTVSVRAAGDVTLRLNYGRSWEGDTGIRKRFSLAVHATNG